ncbi:MAG: ABC transporter permease [Bacillota bacterium]|nr:ABC transporter permease [Bacillota bacterium]
MRAGFYPRLAITGIRKNGRLYLPYLLTCVGMVMMHYIIGFLSRYEGLLHIKGGDVMQGMLRFGSGVLAVFALIFLFYTNSFLIRRRNKELGLYNILGMGKGNIARIILWETLILAALALGIGLAAGIAFSKLAELAMVNIMQGEVAYTLSVSPQAILQTVILFVVIFGLILLNGIRRVRTTNPAALLRSENVGEKPPKANWLLGLGGLILLAGAYYLAVSIQNPISALVWFFVAVGMVIVGTYLLFISGSVLLCRILQKNKGFYYKPAHFVSVSSMAYRMKRNGAGLASICILATMVLVMLTGSACLYFGSEDALRTRYPRDIVCEIDLTSAQGTENETVDALRDRAEGILNAQGVDPSSLVDLRYGQVSGLLAEGQVETDPQRAGNALTAYDDLHQFFFVPLEDYNAMTGDHRTLAGDEALVYGDTESFPGDILSFRGGPAYRIVGELTDFPALGGAVISDVVSAIVIIVPDLDAAAAPLMAMTDSTGAPMLRLHWYYAFDTNAEESVQVAVAEQLWESLGEGSGSVDSLAANRSDFFGTFGSVFFLGILLSIVFLFATVLIIYYKQISEGFEDQARFGIMQKVGMTREDIRRSINAQMLLVFLLPLVTAVVHLAFAFPMVRKLLMLFNLTNLPLLLQTAGISVLIFAVFYILVYRLTSNAYCAIVSN